MKLYHLTKDLNHNGYLNPYVVGELPNGSQCSIRRTYATPTIAGFISKLISQCGNEAEINKIIGTKYKLFELSPELYGDDTVSIIPPDELYANAFVEEAYYTGEHWLTKPVQVDVFSTFTIQIVSIEIESRVTLPYKDRLYWLQEHKNNIHELIKTHGEEVKDFEQFLMIMHKVGALKGVITFIVSDMRFKIL